MRIGIYTQPLRTNYGGILQAWALQVVLRRMGHDVVTFDPSPYKYLSRKRKLFVYAKRLLGKFVGNNTPIRYEHMYNTEFDFKTQYLRPFIQANIIRREFSTPLELSSSEYDALIVGSDQVWRPKYNITYRRTIENAFLDFAKEWKVKRIAYAASFGSDEWEFTPEQTACCSELVTLFDAISVREASGITLCKEHFGINVKQVLDPTMLLTRDDYVELMLKGANSKSQPGEMLCYVLDENVETERLIRSVVNHRGLKPFQTNFVKKNSSDKKQIQPPIEQWLRYFYEAEFIVTDSFHACVFSILFGKPFVAIANKERGVSRYESLLTEFNLTDHLLFTAADYNPENDYSIPENVSDLLMDKRKESMRFLIDAIMR